MFMLHIYICYIHTYIYMYVAYIYMCSINISRHGGIYIKPMLYRFQRVWGAPRPEDARGERSLTFTFMLQGHGLHVDLVHLASTRTVGLGAECVHTAAAAAGRRGLNWSDVLALHHSQGGD